MKKFIITIMVALICITMICSTSSVYSSTFGLTSGAINGETIDDNNDDDDLFANGLIINNELKLWKSDIYSNVTGINGPINITAGNASITGNVTVNKNVEIKHSNKIFGTITRKKVTFPKASYSLPKKPDHLENKGDLNLSNYNSVLESGIYNNVTISGTHNFTVNKSDIYIQCKSLTIGGNTQIIGSKKVTIVTDELNITTPTQISSVYNNINLVVKNDTLSFQNLFMNNVNLYFEGNQLAMSTSVHFVGNIYTKASKMDLSYSVNITGNIQAPKADIAMEESCLLTGGIVCQSLSMEEDCIIINHNKNYNYKKTNNKYLDLDHKIAEPESKTTEPESKTTEPESKTAEPESKTIEPESKTIEPESKTIDP